jgi:hypothetical protein
MLFRARWERLEQIVRMTDFENRDAIMRVYDILEKMWVTKDLEKQFRTILKEKGIGNDFFFEWNDDEVSPKILIWKREIDLHKLKYKL